jgi:L-amino acid N-acyltransferase YncA
MDFTITAMRLGDWPAVERIYLEGIADGHATFETESPGWEKWNSAHHPHSRLVVKQGGQTIAWAALRPVSSRRAYRGVAEVSIYVAESARGKGVGKRLLAELIRHSEQNEIWTLQAGIFPENAASIALHKACGFREVGVRERIGQLGGRWRSTVLLERRSPVVGN